MTATAARNFTVLAFGLLSLGLDSTAFAADGAPRKARTYSEVLAQSAPSDWRTLDPARTLYFELATGRVIIELAPQFAPNHVANILALVRENYFDGLAIMRVQDNYVVQWGDADNRRTIHSAKKNLPAEFDRPARGLQFSALPDTDTYAPQTGMSDGLPAARDLSSDRAWLTHCYGSVGVGRDTDAGSGGGTELYAVIGHAPRHLDRNVTLVGRIVKGIELFSVLPRGTGDLGFYEKVEQRVPIRSIRVAADVPESERTPLEILRTDTPTFAAVVESRRNRTDEWFKHQAGAIEVCNVPLAVRTPAKR